MSSIITHGGKALLSPNGKTINFDALIDQANETTGASDVTLTDAVQTLCDGYGQGGQDDSYKKANEIISGSLTYFKSTSLTSIVDRHFFGQTGLAFTSIPNFNGTLNGYNFYTTDKLKYLNIGKPTQINSMAIQARWLTTLIIQTKSVCAIQSIIENNSAIGLGITTIYVPDLDSNGNALPAQYKVTTNWINHANQIKGYSEAPIYSNSTEYSIGDVCQYNNKFYGYCKEDLQSATGKAPSGTTEDNEYWEYIAEV